MKRAAIDPIAIIAIAVVVCFLEPVVHEAIGHGVAAFVVGAPLQHVSSADMAADESHLPQWAVRVVAAAGIVSNLTFGAIALVLLKRLHSASANIRYFLWLFGHSNLFVGSGYMLALSFVNYGDVADLTAGLPRKIGAQALLTVLGLAVAICTYVHAARSLDEFLGTGDRNRRVVLLTVLPYFVIGTLNTFAGALNPEGPLLILTSAASASFGGNMPMLWLAFAVRGARATTPSVPVTPVRQTAWLAVAAVSLVLLFAVLAPGVPR